MRRALAAVCALATLAPAASAAGLAYAVRAGDHAAVMVYDPASGDKKEIFSDKGLKISLARRGSGGRKGAFYPIAAGRKALFAALTGEPEIYRLTTDGTNKARKLWAMRGIQPGLTQTPFVNAAGDRIAYTASIFREGIQHNFVFIHDPAQEKALVEKDLGPGCQLERGAWLPDGKRSLLCLSCVREAPAYEQYILGEDGAAMTRVPGTEKGLPDRKGHSRPSPVCAGVLRDGSLLVRLLDQPLDSSGRVRPQHESRLVTVDTTGAKPPREVATQARVGSYVSPSPDGAYIAFTDPSGALWVRSAKDGTEKQVLPASKPLTDFLLVGWMD